MSETESKLHLEIVTMGGYSHMRTIIKYTLEKILSRVWPLIAALVTLMWISGPKHAQIVTIRALLIFFSFSAVKVALMLPFS